MLSCREVTELSGDWLDGRLRFRERMALRAHVAMCVHCRRFLRQLRALLGSLERRGDGQAVDAGFVDRVMSTVDSAREERGERHDS